MRTTTSSADTLFDDIVAETTALDLLHDVLGARIVSEPQWRGFDDREAHEDQVRLALAAEAADLFGPDW